MPVARHAASAVIQPCAHATIVTAFAVAAASMAAARFSIQLPRLVAALVVRLLASVVLQLIAHAVTDSVT